MSADCRSARRLGIRAGWVSKPLGPNRQTGRVHVALSARTTGRSRTRAGAPHQFSTWGREWRCNCGAIVPLLRRPLGRAVVPHRVAGRDNVPEMPPFPALRQPVAVQTLRATPQSCRLLRSAPSPEPSRPSRISPLTSSAQCPVADPYSLPPDSNHILSHRQARHPLLIRFAHCRLKHLANS